MSVALLYWILMLLWLVLGVWRSYPFGSSSVVFGGDLLLFILLLILGWHAFGSPIHG